MPEQDQSRAAGSDGAAFSDELRVFFPNQVCDRENYLDQELSGEGSGFAADAQRSRAHSSDFAFSSSPMIRNSRDVCRSSVFRESRNARDAMSRMNSMVFIVFDPCRAKT